MLEYINVSLIYYHIYIFLQIYFELDRYYHNGVYNCFNISLDHCVCDKIFYRVQREYPATYKTRKN